MDIRWTDELLAHLPPGRGVGPALSPPAKAPSLTTTWNGAVDGFFAQAKYLAGAAGEADLQSRTRAYLGTKGKAGSLQDFDVEAFGLGWATALCTQNEWSRDKGVAYKFARYAMLHGGRQTIEALLFAGRVELKYDCSYRGVVSKARLSMRTTPFFPALEVRRNTASPLRTCLQELRGLLALADEESYAAAEQAALEVYGGLAPAMQAMLIYLLPTLREQAVALARAQAHEKQVAVWWPWLAMSGADPMAMIPLAYSFNWSAHTILHPMAPSEGGLEALMAFIEQHPDRTSHALAPLSCLVDERTAKMLARHPETEPARAFFLDQPAMAAEFLDKESALYAEVVRSNPELNPDAEPFADDAELPAMFHKTIKGSLKAFDAWKIHADLRVASTGHALSPAHIEQLGRVLCKAKGRVGSSERQILRDLLEDESSEAFSLAMLEDYLSRGSYGRDKWPLRSLMALGGDKTVDRLCAAVKDMQYPDQVAVVEVLEGIGSDHSLIRLAHFAEKGRGRGFKNAAKSAMSRIARAKGLNEGQLADRLVPTLGLDAQGRMVLDYGPRSFTVGFDEKLKPFVVDDKGKKRASLPKPGAKDDAALALPAEARWKLLKKDVRTLASTQLGRFETSMRVQRRWTGVEFDRYLAGHPLVGHLVRRLVWGVYTLSGQLKGTFRVNEEGAVVDAQDEAWTRPDGPIGVVHPLDLGDADRAAWGETLADYEIMQPFEQLSRDVYPPDSPDSQAILQQIDGLTMKGGHLYRLLNQGWNRGGVEDAGQWYEAWTTGPGFTLRVVTTHGVNITGGYGSDEDSEVSLKVKQEGPDPIRWSEAVHDLRLLLG